MLPLLNYADGDHEAIRAQLTHPQSVSGLSDGGAHCGIICDASLPTTMLTHWTRDRTRGELLPLEWIVKKQTHDTAELYGMSDRGTLEVGKRADVNIIDFANLRLQTPEMIYDLPAGGRRLIQRSEGYVATIVAGEITRVTALTPAHGLVVSFAGVADVRFGLGIPVGAHPMPQWIQSADAIAAVTRAAADSGFDHVFVTDHPLRRAAGLRQVATTPSIRSSRDGSGAR